MDLLQAWVLWARGHCLINHTVGSPKASMLSQELEPGRICMTSGLGRLQREGPIGDWTSPGWRQAMSSPVQERPGEGCQLR